MSETACRSIAGEASNPITRPDSPRLSAIGRVSGDRARDLDPDLRERITKRLQAMGADETTIRPVREYHELEAGQTAQALGDSLPVGLRLLGEAAKVD